mgnify:CR=1 FL=1
MVIKIYIHRVLLISTYTFLAVLLFGVLGQSFLATILDFFEIIFGASIVTLLRKIIANYDIKELFRLCFSFAFIDWLLYSGNIEFRLNIQDRLRQVFKFKNYLWE